MKDRKLHSTIPEKQALKNFSVPEGYFEQNAIQLKQVVKEHSQEKAKVFHLKPVLTWMSAAAVVTVIVFGVINRKQTSATVLTDDDLYALMDVGYVSFSNYDLATELELDDEAWYSIEEEEAQDYLEYSDLNYLEESLLYDNY